MVPMIVKNIEFYEKHLQARALDEFHVSISDTGKVVSYRIDTLQQ